MRTPALLTAAALLIAAPSARAAPPATLDGEKSTRHQWSTPLSGFALVPAGEQPGCAAPGCDTTSLRLLLPSGRRTGHLRIKVVAPSTIMVRVTLRDATGRHIDSSGTPVPLGSGASYEVRLAESRLVAGGYEVELLAEAGQGRVSADVIWTANPPERRP